MRRVAISWLLLPLLFLLHVGASEQVQAQSQPKPTTAQEFAILNSLGQGIRLTVPLSGVSRYTVLFPTTAPGMGDLFFASNTAGQTSWLTPGADGSVLTVSGGLPAWQNPNALFWGVTGNSGTKPTVNFLGTTDAENLAFRTNNILQMQLTTDGDLILTSPVNTTRTVGFGNLQSSIGHVSQTNPLNMATQSNMYVRARANLYMLADANNNSPDNTLHDNTFRWGINATDRDSTGYIELMTLTGLGRLGIGETDPQNLLHVSATSDPVRVEGMAIDNTLTQLLVADGTGILHQRDLSSITDNFWSVTGNSGTTPGTHFLGTVDAQAMHLYVNGGADNSLILNTNGSLQRDNAGNARGSNAVDMQISRSAVTQVASGPSSTISGGTGNRASGQSTFIGGGQLNVASGDAATVGGGLADTASGPLSTIAGGRGNNASGIAASIIGGVDNSALADSSTVGGGGGNAVLADASGGTVGGGRSNTIASSARFGVIAGGDNNTIDAGVISGAIGGGTRNAVSGDNGFVGGGLRNTSTPTFSAIVGGESNTIATGASYSIIGVAEGSEIGAGASHGVIVGGGRNTIGADANFSFIGGGQSNSIGSNASHSVILGGQVHRVESGARHGTIGGGQFHRIGINAVYSVIAGGDSNTVDSAATYSAILGGKENTIDTLADYSVIVGGHGMTLRGDGSFGFLGANNTGANDMIISAADVAVFGNADVWLANNDGNVSQLRFYERQGTSGTFPTLGTNYTAFAQNDALTNNITYDLPATLSTGSVGDERFLRATTTVANSAAQLEWVPAPTVVDGIAWLLVGNSGTNPATNFIGTTDAQRFAFRTNNVERMTLGATGNLGLGTTSPAQLLDVRAGNIRLDTGTTARGLQFGDVPDYGVFGVEESGMDNLYTLSQSLLYFIADADNGLVDTDSSGNGFRWGINAIDRDSTSYDELMTLNGRGFLRLGAEKATPFARFAILNQDQGDAYDDVFVRSQSNTNIPEISLQRSRASIFTPTGNLLQNDIVGMLTFAPFRTGTSFVSTAAIRAVADINQTSALQNTRMEFQVTSGTTTSTAMTIDANSRVGIGIAAPAQVLHVVGNAGKTVGGTTWVNLSDERTKNVQGDYTKGLSDILDLHPVVFQYKSDNPWGAASNVDQYGFIAQDVEKVFPEAVEAGEDGYLTFNMHPILVAYTNAIIELNNRNQELEKMMDAKNQEFEKMVKDLSARIQALESESSEKNNTFRVEADL